MDDEVTKLGIIIMACGLVSFITSNIILIDKELVTYLEIGKFLWFVGFAGVIFGYYGFREPSQNDRDPA